MVKIGLEGTSVLGAVPWLKAGPALLVLLLMESSLSLEILQVPQQFIPALLQSVEASPTVSICKCGKLLASKLPHQG